MSLIGSNTDIREQFQGLLPEVDYQALVTQMPLESHPRRKIGDLQRKRILIRLKKGFYVFSQSFIGRPYSLQIVANLLYGPSYLSLEYALGFYGLIPEKVELFTSVTTGKNKNFQTVIGSFSYRHLSHKIYPYAVTLKKGADGRSFLIATPEKALLDTFTLKFDRKSKPSMTEITEVLINDLRIDLQKLKEVISKSNLALMRNAYKNRKWEKVLIERLIKL